MNSVLPYSGNRKACRTGCDYEETNSFELLDSGRYLKPSYARKTTGKIQPVLDIEWYKRMGGIDIEQAAAFFRVDAAALVAGQGFEPWTSGL